MVQFAISAMLVWLAINIAFVVLRLRATRDSAAPSSDRPGRPYPEAIPLRHRQARSRAASRSHSDAAAPQLTALAA